MDVNDPNVARFLIAVLLADVGTEGVKQVGKQAAANAFKVAIGTGASLWTKPLNELLKPLIGKAFVSTTAKATSGKPHSLTFLAVRM